MKVVCIKTPKFIKKFIMFIKNKFKPVKTQSAEEEQKSEE